MGQPGCGCRRKPAAARSRSTTTPAAAAPGRPAPAEPAAPGAPGASRPWSSDIARSRSPAAPATVPGTRAPAAAAGPVRATDRAHRGYGTRPVCGSSRCGGGSPAAGDPRGAGPGCVPDVTRPGACRAPLPFQTARRGFPDAALVFLYAGSRSLIGCRIDSREFVSNSRRCFPAGLRACGPGIFLWCFPAGCGGEEVGVRGPVSAALRRRRGPAAREACAATPGRSSATSRGACAATLKPALGNVFGNEAEVLQYCAERLVPASGQR
ncbi:hypothetical protein ACVWXB_008156 [Streptomyces sp. TE12347]